MSPRPLRRLATVLVIGAVGLGLAGCSGDNNSDAARVTYHDDGGDHTVRISRSEFTDELNALQENKVVAQQLKANGANVNSGVSTDQRLASTWLSTRIRQTVIDAEFASADTPISPDDRTKSEQDQTSTFGEAGWAAFSVPFRNTLLERDARLYAVFRHFESCPSGRFVSHILLPTESKASATLALINRGREKFTDLAKAQSTDTASGANGGALGCLSSSEFVAPFQSAAEAAPIGTVVGPVKTRFGYHLILVRKWDPVADRQYAQALADSASRALTKRFDALKVWVNPLYGTWGTEPDSNGNPTPAVVPPVVPQPRVCREATTACSGSTTTTVPAGG
jgi:parvulin-like peptidyl-prolyl isomerase